jgi:hypothetical protein
LLRWQLLLLPLLGPLLLSSQALLLLLAHSLLLLLAVHLCFFEASVAVLHVAVLHVAAIDIAVPHILYSAYDTELLLSSCTVVSKHSLAHVPLPRNPCTSEGGGHPEGRGQLVGQRVVVYL